MGGGSWPDGLAKKDGAQALSGAESVDTATTQLDKPSRTKNLIIEYKGKARYQANAPGWATGRSTQPRRKPRQTPQPIAQHVIMLHQTLVQSGQQGSATAIQQALTQQGIALIPSLRTIYRILQRHAQEAI